MKPPGRGSALLFALVVCVVLTALGIGLAYVTTSEDRLSGNVKLQTEGFYAAEVGLRAAETILGNGQLSSSGSIRALLTAAAPDPGGHASPSTFTPPGGGHPAVLLYDAASSTAYRDVAVPMPAGPADCVRYSLYVRNDEEDVFGGNSDDSNQVVNVISVGFVVLPDGSRGVTKILEEQLTALNVGSPKGNQKGGNAGGTGSGSS